jgi:adenine-specific DNA-methyltransferase
MILKSRIAAASATTFYDSASLSTDPSGCHAAYVKTAPADHRKRFGQFFTPPKVGALMADWVTSNGAESILDPALGTGVLISACMSRSASSSYTAFEKDQLIASYVPDHIRNNVRLFNSDFLKHDFDMKFDGVIMNPPYIRHRELEGCEKERTRISLEARCVIPRSANLYVYFAVKALTLLRERGRAALLIPGEWMSANFSATFKEYILRSGLLKEVILFSNCSNVFEDALTTASILLCER